MELSWQMKGLKAEAGNIGAKVVEDYEIPLAGKKCPKG